jgi:hypothetical protein
VGWSIGYDAHWRRDIGYGVPATCDHPGCGKGIDRGLAFVCGGEPYGGEHGCGLYFCGEHLFIASDFRATLCDRCLDGRDPFEATPDVAEWIRHKLTDESWQGWRADNPDIVATLKLRLSADAVARGSEASTD